MYYKEELLTNCVFQKAYLRFFTHSIMYCFQLKDNFMNFYVWLFFRFISRTSLHVCLYNVEVKHTYVGPWVPDVERLKGKPTEVYFI